MKGLCKLLLYMAALLAPFARDIAQTNNISDTAYVNSLILQSRTYYGVNADSAFSYARKALDYAQKTGNAKSEAESWRMLGNTYEMIGDYHQMLSAYHKSKSIALRIGNLSQIGKVNLNIALFYRQMGEYEAAIRQVGKDTPLTVRDADSIELAYHFSYLSDIALHRNKYDTAIAYANQALAVAEALKDSMAVATFRNDVAKVLLDSRQYDEAIRLHLQSLAYYKHKQDRLGETETMSMLANAWLKAGKTDSAMQYARQGMVLANALHRKQELKQSAEALAAIYQTKGDYPSALHYFQLFKLYADSLFSDNLDRQLFAAEARYEFERREDSLKKEVLHREKVRQHREHIHTLQIVLAFLIILFLSGLVFVLWRNKITSRRHNELLTTKNQEIEQQKEAMEHQAVQLLLNNQEKDKLFSIIAHDLRGPLNSLKGLMDLLKEKNLPESEIRSMMAELSRNVGYSSELVSNLLFWASSQLHGIVMNPVVLPMRQLMNEILILFQRQSEEKKLHIENAIDPELKAYADRDMTQVILRNLVSNAIKFCRNGDQICISSRQKDGKVEICIADTGIGIKEEILEKIRRKESVTTYGTAKEKGTGLGMLLCREFAIANQGEFHVDSEWGKGSQFYLTMPVAANSSSISV